MSVPTFCRIFVSPKDEFTFTKRMNSTGQEVDYYATQTSRFPWTDDEVRIAINANIDMLNEQLLAAKVARAAWLLRMEKGEDS